MPTDSPSVEKSLVGALMLSPEKIACVVASVNSNDFERRDCLQVFEAIRFLSGTGSPIDPVLIADELRRRGELEALGVDLRQHINESATASRMPPQAAQTRFSTQIGSFRLLGSGGSGRQSRKRIEISSPERK